MAVPVRTNRRFRERLHEELVAWRDEGLVSPDQVDALMDRYDLQEVAKRRTGLLLATTYTIGVVLIAIGVISFVAANWQSIPKSVKLAGGLAVMLGAHVSGYVLWRVKATSPRLGQALVLLGTLVLGANLVLASQLYHVHANASNVFGLWTLGAAVTAYSVTSPANAILAVLTSLLWYGFAMVEHSAFVEDLAVLYHAADWYPYALVVAGMPFAYMARSAPVACCVLLGFAVTAHVPLVPDRTARWLVLMGVAVILLLSGYGAFHTVRRPRAELAGPALVLGAVAAVVFCGVLSFEGAARDVVGQAWFSRPRLGGFGYWPIALVAGAGLALWAGSVTRAWSRPGLRPFVVAIWCTTSLLAGVVIGWTPVSVLVLSNSAIAILGAGLIWSGSETLRRDVFWGGVLLIAALIICRFFEYETGLLVKSAVFALAGCAVIASGISFEHILKRRGQAHA